MKAVAIGDLLIDFNPLGVDEYGYPSLQAQPGGDVANYLVAMSQYGADTALIGKVGDDTFGRLLINTLKAHRICADGMIADPSTFTTLGFVTLDASGDRDFSFMHAADTRLSFDEVNLSLFQDADVLHFSTVSMTDEPSRETIRKVVELAKAQGILISFDPNVRLTLWKDPQQLKEQILWALTMADVVKISNDEIAFLYSLPFREGAEKLLHNSPVQLVFVTCGKQGCYYSNRSSKGFTKAISDIHTIDTVGAGDIFGGSAMWKLLSCTRSPSELTEAQLEEITQFAVIASGLSTTKHGGLTSVPTMEEIVSYARSHGLLY